MRLNSEQVEAIKQEIERFFGAQAGVWLFGSRGYKNQRGFTLIELIMTMIILGIISAVAIPRFFDANVFQSHGAANQVKAALRYGQKIAIAQRRTTGLTVMITSDATSNCGTALNGAGNIDCVISKGVTVSPALPQSVTFDALGRRTSATGSITVGSTPITIEAETGYVH